MKIVHLITTIERGGAENQLVVLVEQQITGGHKVEIIYLKGKPELSEILESLGANVTDDFANIKPWSQLRQMARYLKEYGSILHCHLPRAELLGACLTFLCKEVVLVITRHNAEKFFPKAPGKISSTLAKFVTSRAKIGIAISNAVANYNYENSECKQEFKFEKIYYGYPSKVMTDKVNSIKEFELPTGKFIYGTVARLTPQKNLLVLLQAFAKMPHHFRDESLLCIVGSGELKENLRRESFELGIDKQVIWVPRSQNVRQYYEQMDVFILPSNYEGFGLVLLEAMECGVPIIGANNSAIAEVLANDSGRLFETGNAEDLANSMIDLREEFLLLHYQSAGKNRLNFFSPNVMSHKVDEAYKRALNRR